MTADKEQLYIPGTILAQLGLNYGDRIGVKSGNRKHQAMVVKGNSNNVKINDILAGRLLLPPGQNYNAKLEAGTVIIGPLLGILATGYNSSRGSFGAQDSFFRKLIDLARTENGVAFVFTLEDIDWDHQTLRGYTLSNPPNGPWIHRKYSFPDVCYNRIFATKPGVSSRQALTQMGKTGTISFNAGVGSKWRVYQILKTDQEIVRCLPDTYILKGKKMLDSMLNRYHSVYLKPVNGCKGQGIIRIKKTANQYTYKKTRDRQELTSPNLSHIIHKIDISKRKSMLIQPAIRCPLEGGHFDFRVMVQKDSYNRWSVTGIAARVGAKGRITTNLHTGGRAETLGTILKKCGFTQPDITKIEHDLKGLSILIARALENHARVLGELGLDFILDSNGHIWFLEANPKPSRKSFSDMEANQIRRLSILRPVQFARYLAGFSGTEGG
ncbi:MAG: YheC/YheD family protein [Chitinophagales bacterium]